MADAENGRSDMSLSDRLARWDCSRLPRRRSRPPSGYFRKKKRGPAVARPPCGGVPGNTYLAHLLLLLSNWHPPFWRPTTGCHPLPPLSPKTILPLPTSKRKRPSAQFWRVYRCGPLPLPEPYRAGAPTCRGAPMRVRLLDQAAEGSGVQRGEAPLPVLPRKDERCPSDTNSSPFLDRKDARGMVDSVCQQSARSGGRADRRERASRR